MTGNAILFCPKCNKQREVVLQREQFFMTNGRSKIQIFTCPKRHEIERNIGIWRRPSRKKKLPEKESDTL